jgi:hypothetical protein
MADSNDKETCNSCRFFYKGDRNMGLCHRYPSSINTSSNSWCGEFVLSEESLSLDALVKAIVEPISEPKKPRGRPKKS